MHTISTTPTPPQNSADQPHAMRPDAAAAAASTAARDSPPNHASAAEGSRGEVVVEVDGVPEGHVACRICHLATEGDGVPPGSEVILLGCRCKDELGSAHRRCAEAWFRVKGDRCCEICGSDAKNIVGLEVKKFMEEWHGRRTASTGSSTPERESSSCWRQQTFCNFLLACLLIAFMLPWFLRVNIF